MNSRKVHKTLSGWIYVISAIYQLSLLLPSLASAQTNDERKYLLLYFKEEELVVESPTRGEKSIIQVAENITVVTAEDIKRMNAHTVADVLNTVNGVQVFISGGPGSSALASILGSENRHVAVYIDGIPVNNLSDNITDLGTITVQNIEKIEVIKGPASSAWGSALGGVVNITTKTGRNDNRGGFVFASYGGKNTGDFRIEASGKENRFGCYLFAGRLQTDGFRPHNDFAGNTAFVKLAYEFTAATTLSLSVAGDSFARGMVEIPAFDFFMNNEADSVRSNISLQSHLNGETKLELSAWMLKQDYDYRSFQLSTDNEIAVDEYLDRGYGASARLNWKQERHNIVIAVDIDSRDMESDTIAGNNKRIKRTAYYLNDTLTMNNLSVTPGVRFDRTDTNGAFTSPSIGATYKLAEELLIRAYAARGFHIPSLAATYGDNQFHVANPELKMERVNSYQVGMETTALRHLWVKMALFRNDLDDVIVSVPIAASQLQAQNVGKERREGLELEVKTKAVYQASVSAGATFITSKDRETGLTLPNIPQRTYDLGVQYAGWLTATVKAHYIYWNYDPVMNGKYDDFIVDLHLQKQLYDGGAQLFDIFADAHNLFDKRQYPMEIYKNPGRWFEVGIRYAF